MNWITKLEFNHPIQNPTLKSKARNKTELKLTYFLYPKEIKKKKKKKNKKKHPSNKKKKKLALPNPRAKQRKLQWICEVGSEKENERKPHWKKRKQVWAKERACNCNCRCECEAWGVNRSVKTVPTKTSSTCS